MFVLSVMLPVLATVTITGTVKNASGTPVDGAQVTITLPSGSSNDKLTATAGPDGVYVATLTSLATGTVTVAANGSTASRAVNASSQTSLTINIPDNATPPPSGSSGGSIGGDISGGNSGVTEQPSTTPSTETSEEKVSVEINGITISSGASLLGDGTVSIILGDDVIAGNAKSDVFRIAIHNQTQVNLGVPVFALGTQALEIATDMGTVYISNEILKKLGALFNGTVTVSIKKGSFIIELLDQNGKAIAYNDANNPLILTLPYDGKGKNENELNAVVGVRKIKDSVVKVYNGVYESGYVKFNTPQTGTYDVDYRPNSYADAKNMWAEGYINFVTARNISEGVDANTYGINAKLSRALFVYELAKATGEDINAFATSTFSDVKAGAWYTKAVGWANKLGVTNGKTATTFEPNTLVTREEMATMLYRYIVASNLPIPAIASVTPFADEDKISDWALKAVQAIKDLGIIGGREGNVFDPKATATRAEYAKILAEFVKKFK